MSLETTAPHILHGDVVDSVIARKSEVKGQDYEICRNGCKLFGIGDLHRQCPLCEAPRYKDELNIIPHSTMKIMSIGDLLAQMLANPTTRELLGYRANRSPVPGLISDIFDGENYKDLVRKGLFTNPNDIAIGLFTDGFVNQKKGKQSYTIVHIIIYNLDPSIR